MDAQAHIVCKHEGADVQGSAVCMGHPVTFHIHQRLNGLDVILDRDLRDAQTVSRILHPLCIAVRAEQLNGIVCGAVSLHALKDLLCVVEHDRRRVQLERSIGDDTGIVPAFALGVVHDEHVVGELLAEAELGLILRLLFRTGRPGDLDIQHDNFPSFLISHS